MYITQLVTDTDAFNLDYTDDSEDGERDSVELSEHKLDLQPSDDETDWSELVGQPDKLRNNIDSLEAEPS